jgi:hypothetical protein
MSTARLIGVKPDNFTHGSPTLVVGLAVGVQQRVRPDERALWGTPGASCRLAAREPTRRSAIRATGHFVLACRAEFLPMPDPEDPAKRLGGRILEASLRLALKTLRCAPRSVSRRVTLRPS